MNIGICKGRPKYGLVVLPLCLYRRLINRQPGTLCRYCEAWFRINHTLHHRFDDLKSET